MFIVIRISGQVGLPKEAKEALYRIRIRKKYSAVLMKPTAENKKLLKKIRNFVAYGTIDDGTLKKLIEKRAKPLQAGKKVDAAKVISGLESKSPKELGIKPFFALHPPRKGIEAKQHFGVGKGVLGDNREKINDLVRRML